MKRIPRAAWQKLIYTRIYKCGDCQTRAAIPRRWVLSFSTLAHCPLCGTERLDVRSKPDKVDGMRRGPIRLLYRLLGGRLYHCHGCRLQFYDVRSRAGSTMERKALRPEAEC